MQEAKVADERLGHLFGRGPRNEVCPDLVFVSRDQLREDAVRPKDLQIAFDVRGNSRVGNLHPLEALSVQGYKTQTFRTPPAETEQRREPRLNAAQHVQSRWGHTSHFSYFSAGTV